MADGSVRNRQNKFLARINSLLAGKRNLKANLNESVKNFGEKNNKFLEFIGSVLILLGLVDAFSREINDFFAKGKKYEPKLKQILVDCFQSNIACNLDDVFRSNEVYNPANPNNIPYFKTRIDKLDFFGLFKVNPNSVSGGFLYGTSSQNTLDRTIKTAIDSGNLQNWRQILLVELDPADNNVLNFYVDSLYLNRPVNALIMDLVNNINLIPQVGMLSSVMNNLYGSVSYSLQPTRIDPLSMFNIMKLNQYIEKILDGGEDIVIDESFFEFTNEEIFTMEQLSQNISKNFLQITSCNNAESVITSDDLFPILNEILSASTFNEQISVIEAGMTKLEIIASKNVLRIDLPKFKIEFFFNIFKQLINSIIQLVYSPQFLTIMFIYFKLANPSSTNPVTYTDFKDFLKKTRNILICIVNKIFLYLLIVIVIPIIIKRLVTDANREKVERAAEKYELYKEQYLAITGTLDAIKATQFLRDLASSV